MKRLNRKTKALLLVGYLLLAGALAVGAIETPTYRGLAIGLPRSSP